MTLWHECLRLLAVEYEAWHPDAPAPGYSHFHLFLVATGYFRR